jgi:hypothetical protein
MDTLKHSELIEELRFAKQEQARLTEMVLLLASTLDEPRARQLRVELAILSKRVSRLAEELSKLHATSARPSAA